MWNEGVIEGLKIASVFVKQKILEDTDNIVLHKIFFDIQQQIELQVDHKRQQEFQSKLESLHKRKDYVR